MSSKRPRTDWTRAAGALVATSACAALVWSPAVRDVARSGLAHFSWSAVAAIVPLQVIALVLCGLALRALGAGVSLNACLLTRWIRDAGGNLLVFAPGLGEAAGLRTLTLLGASVGPAFEAIALDTLAESMAQAPYIGLGLALSRPGRTYALELLAQIGPLAAGGPVAALFVLATCGALLCAVVSGRLKWVGAAWASLNQALRRQGGPLALSFALHFLAWMVGGTQLFVAAHLMRVSLSPVDALALEGLVYGLRGICFIVPGGLGVQEAAIVVGGALFGLAPVNAAALAFTLRARDVLVGAPALASWAVLEAGSAFAAKRAARDRAPRLREARPTEGLISP